MFSFKERMEIVKEIKGKYKTFNAEKNFREKREILKTIKSLYEKLNIQSDDKEISPPKVDSTKLLEKLSRIKDVLESDKLSISVLKSFELDVDFVDKFDEELLVEEPLYNEVIDLYTQAIDTHEADSGDEVKSDSILMDLSF